MSEQELALYEIYYRRPDFGPKRKRLIPDKVLIAFAMLWAILALAFLVDAIDSTIPPDETTVEKLLWPTTK
jgi:hypothetical protein